ncbi:MAG: hypothetical protein K9N46_03475 [Candidatus Marinimicrobia bacterium]|nr:hypothetical protein [Candidatus Neomarinimicrobiota bacterium]MCF7829623.1 hypothetical protein [Candidatus Neomarinimicrobiota bacterium]MCF7879783.1 hypothetical protein [Candidatus Neomarinimicrobiota bacterium]
MTLQEKIHSLARSQVTVLGAQRTGMAAARLLKQWGAKVFISDMDEDALSEKCIKELAKAGIEYELGSHSERVYDADLVIISPGIPESALVVQELQKLEIPMISEVELASWFVDSPVIAVTGSNGKTTTSTLISKFLDINDLNPALCGNIGNPFANELLEESESSKKKSSSSK